ncbi:hypothetical protein Lalb_Chr19g0128021 [Lupinus albus]|uniref:Uncharacterized protein n=1 Tax=Lupinus albus TaxID=3870 RepID=A0A6A4NNM4_LUPAL|nr:hypothetical protein Lalb_Chr19g0128021 [Lupinus albus]
MSYFYLFLYIFLLLFIVVVNKMNSTLLPFDVYAVNEMQSDFQACDIIYITPKKMA